VTGQDGMLDLDVDPKTAWALQHRGQFPVDLNKAPKAMLLRVPGLGVTSVERIVAARKVHIIRYDDLARMRVSMKKVQPFIVLADYQPGRSLDANDLKHRLQQSIAPQQLGLFKPV
jgi:predicted DNA-binding helix-hairpin-helix protein